MTTFDEWRETMTLEGGTQDSHMRQAWDAALQSLELEGATTVPAEGTKITTAGEFAAVWNSHSVENRARLFEALQSNAEDSYKCFIEEHLGRLQNITDSIQDVARERARHSELGYTTEHDDVEGVGHLVYQAVMHITKEDGPTSIREDLVKSASLLIAAIDFLDRH